MIYKKTITVFAVCLVFLSVFIAAAPIVEAKKIVTTTFGAVGYTNYSGDIMRINGTLYTISDLGWRTFSASAGDVWVVEALSSFRNTDGPSLNYTFNCWKDGAAGYSGNSIKYIVPNSNSKVTANYVLITHKAIFTATGFSNFNDQVVIIDGKTYTLSAVGSGNPFTWDAGTKHTVQAVTPIKNADSPLQLVYNFTSWNAGSGLTDASGIFTMPNQDVTVTATYTRISHTARFTIAGTSNFGDQVIVIDGVTYTYWQIGSKAFEWVEGSTHSVQALSPVRNTDSPKKGYSFTSWTNGNGLTDATGTFTMPGNDVTVTANYVQSTVHVTFQTSGLSNIPSGTTILTVDGVNYGIWQIPNINLQWDIGSTHTVTAASIVTDQSSNKRYFTSWTNGNGLTENTGTLTVPNAANFELSVTANYGSAPPAVVTALTLSVTPSTVDRPSITSTVISGALTSTGTGITGKTIAITYFDGSNWLPITSTTTTTGGTYSYNWAIPDEVANGQYVVKAEFAGDSAYLGSSATTSSGGLVVLPEYEWGALVALLACFAAAVLFYKRRRTTKP